MQSIALRYGVVLVALVAGDALWLSYFARAMFRPVLGGILLDNPRWGAAILFYLLYALGVLVFPITLGGRGGWTSAALYGGVFGFLAYMTYDLTNLATIKAWSLPLALIDIGWGAVLTAAASAIGTFIAPPMP
jgi:uncharacterized membrane protein